MSTQLSSASSSLELSNPHSKLSNTRSSLASHAEKVRELETVLTDHDSMKKELAMLKELMADRTDPANARSPSRGTMYGILEIS